MVTLTTKVIGSLVASVLVAIASTPLPVSAFYIPGLTPTVYKDNDRLPLFVNKIYSKKSPLDYSYADLPFVCPPPKDAKKAWLNLGEVLRGDRISSSNYEVVHGSFVLFVKVHHSSLGLTLSYCFTWNLNTVDRGQGRKVQDTLY